MFGRAVLAALIGLVANAAHAQSAPQVVPPRLIHFVETPYPNVPNSTEAAVMLRLEIDAVGHVTKVEVIQSTGPPFDELAAGAAASFVFEPALIDGEPTAVSIQFRYVFKPPPPEPPPAATPTAIDDHDTPADLEPSLPPQPTIDDEGVVRAPRIYHEVAERRIEREEGERVAGVQGDVIRVVGTLGGVTRAGAAASEVVVWGAEPSDTRLYVDGVPIPRLFHLGRSRSVLAAPLVRSVKLVPGGFGARYGRAIGGLVEIETTERDPGSRTHFGGAATLDPIDGGVVARAQTRDTWLSVAARHSLQQWTIGSLVDDRARTLVPIPTYWDYQAKASQHLAGGAQLSLMLLGAHDQSERGIPSINADRGFTERTHGTFHRGAARLQREHGGGLTTTVASWAGIDESLSAMFFGDVTARSEVRLLRGGLRAAQRRRLSEEIALEAGLDLELTRARARRHGALSLPTREGDVWAFGQHPGNRLSADEWRVTLAGLGGYAALPIDFAEHRWSLEPGLRFEPTMISGDRILPVRPVEPAVGYARTEFALDPRIKGSWSPFDWLRLYAAAGRYHQAPDVEDLSPVFGNPELTQAQALHLLAGVALSPDQMLALELTGFVTEQSDRAVRPNTASPAVARLLESTGTGHNRGLQLSLRLAPSRSLLLRAAYSLTRAERSRGPGAPTRLSDFDRTHVLQVAGSYRHGSGIELGGRLHLATGAPRTPVVGAVFDAGADRYDPVFGPQNSIRVPTFVELSVMLAYRHTARWGYYKLWLDIQNATNHDNAEELFYSANFSQRGFVAGLPTLPLAGMELHL